MTMSTDLLQQWLITYAIHSTLLLGAAALIDWRVVKGRAHWQELLWKSVLIGAIASTTLQVATGTSGVVSVQWANTSSSISANANEPAVNTLVPAQAKSGKPSAKSEIAPLAEAVGPVPPTTGAGSPWLGLWLLGAALMLARLQVSAFRLRLMLLTRSPFPSTLRPASLPRWVNVSVCPGLSQPIAVGLREICIPEGMLTMPQPRIDAALAHELAHLQRADGIWRWFCLVTRSILFFQPLNVVASRAISRAAEQCSDQLAVKNGARSSDLIDVLACFALNTRTRPSATPALASPMLGRPHEVVTRIENLVHGRLHAGPGWRWFAVTILTLSVAAGLTLPGISTGGNSRTSVEISREQHMGTLVDVKGQFGGSDIIKVQHRSDGLEVTLKAQGPVAFDASEQNLVKLEGYFDLTVVEAGVKKRMRYEGADGFINHDFWIEGKRQGFRPEGQAWFAAQLPRLFRISGLFADTRARRIYDTAGVGALISEASMVKGDHARGQYLTAVVGRPLTSSEVTRLLETSTQIIGSDVEKRQVLSALANHHPEYLDWSKYFETSAAIYSDVERRQALQAALPALPGHPELAEGYANATKGIRSDVEQRQALQSLIAHSEFASRSVPSILQAAEELQSDLEQRQLLLNLLKTEMVSTSQVLDLVELAAKQISSNLELGQLLDRVDQQYEDVAVEKALERARETRKNGQKRR
ncbi:MAG: M56 family metallopeptidase [Lysobacterales bacterium]